MIDINISSSIYEFQQAHGVDWIHSIWRKELWKIVGTEECFVASSMGCYYFNPTNDVIIRLGTPLTQIKSLGNNWFNWNDSVFKTEMELSCVYEEIDIEDDILYIYQKGQNFGDAGTEVVITDLWTCNTKAGSYQAPAKQSKYDYNKD